MGGTFDPIHFGHLRLAEEMAQHLALDAVRFTPAAQPPHRTAPLASDVHREAMVRLAIADNPRFSLDRRELERSGPSYMFDTLNGLRNELGNAAQLYLLLGADAFLGLTNWYRWQALFDLSHIAVAHRPGFALDSDTTPMPPELQHEWQKRFRTQKDDTASGNIFACEITALDISASAIRHAYQYNNSPRYLLPDSVLGYIHENSLYPSGTP